MDSSEVIEISIVIPLFNEEASLNELVGSIKKALSDKFSYEIIFVDDGSTDRSWLKIKELSEGNSNISGISFRRNYGKSTGSSEGI